MDRGEAVMTVPAVMAVGIGCRAGCEAPAIAALVRRALALAPAPGAAALALFTSVDKQNEAGIAQAAAALSLPVVFLPRVALEAAAPAAETRSERVVALFGVPSVAETAALAGAGLGSRLVVKRISEAGASCAVALGGEAPP
jgi:cobalt-precorrin 5A hydrolase